MLPLMAIKWNEVKKKRKRNPNFSDDTDVFPPQNILLAIS